jgi:hypothetical protein
LKEPLLWSDAGFEVVPLRPADRTKENCIRAQASIEVAIPEGSAVGIDGRAADEQRLRSYVEIESVAERGEH